MLDKLALYGGLQAEADPASPHLGGSVRGGDPFTHAPSVWDYCIARFGLTSVMDLGSGAGTAALYFHRRGIQVLAVDGLRQSVQASLHPAMQHDLTRGPVVTKVDMVHCQEVVEHIDAHYLPHLLDSLSTGRIILMSHAVPGQTGHHHVNCQPSEYWVDQLGRHGCALLAEDSRRVRALGERDGAIYLAHTGLVFMNRNRD
jgi:hypothetical protein